MRTCVDLVSPRSRYILGTILLLLVLAGIVLTVDVDPYLGGPPQQFAIMEHGHEVATATFVSVRLPDSPVPISFTTNSASYRNAKAGRRVEMERVRWGRLSLGTQATVWDSKERITMRVFVSRWSRRSIEYDVGNGLRICVRTGESIPRDESTVHSDSVISVDSI